MSSIEKFLSQCVTSVDGNFVSTSEFFPAYETAVSISTDDDGVHGQTKFLIKRSSFNRVRIFSCLHNFRPLMEFKRANHCFELKFVSAILKFYTFFFCRYN